MSAYRDSLAAAAEPFLKACRDMDVLTAAGELLAVAEAAHYPGHPLGDTGAIAARYAGLQEAAQGGRAA